MVYVNLYIVQCFVDLEYIDNPISYWGMAIHFHQYHSSKGPSKTSLFRGTNSVLTYHPFHHESDHAKNSLYKYRVKIPFDYNQT